MISKFKSLTLAIILSILYPGFGHLYVGFRFVGVVWMLVAGVLLWLCYACFRSPLGFHESGGWTCLTFYAVAILVSAIRAYLAAVAYNKNLEVAQHMKKEQKEKDRGYDLYKSRWK